MEGSGTAFVLFQRSAQIWRTAAYPKLQELHGCYYIVPCAAFVTHCWKPNSIPYGIRLVTLTQIVCIFYMPPHKSVQLNAKPLKHVWCTQNGDHSTKRISQKNITFAKFPMQIQPFKEIFLEEHAPQNPPLHDPSTQKLKYPFCFHD